jgi:hypothetical protein
LEVAVWKSGQVREVEELRMSHLRREHRGGINA